MITVGWIGLGAMGAPMASCVARAGYTVAAFDVDPQKAVALAAEGVKPADTVAAAADGADVLVLMVATAQQAESVLWGRGNAAAALKPGAVVLLMATVGPAAVEDWAKRLEPDGVEIVDAPVSGGAARAGQGDLLIMVSGSKAGLGVAQPLLDVMARNAPSWARDPVTGRRSSWSTSCSAGFTSPSPRKPSPTQRRLALKPAQRGRSCAMVRRRPSCSMTAGPA